MQAHLAAPIDVHAHAATAVGPRTQPTAAAAGHIPRQLTPDRPSGRYPVNNTMKVPGRLLAWTALLVALAASVAANVAYARPAPGPRLTAGTAPVLVVLAAGLLEQVPLSRAQWWQRWLAGGGLAFVVLAAFATSYQHQSALLRDYGNPALSAVLLPFAVDALIIMASTCLAVIAQRHRDLAATTPNNPPTPAATLPEVPAETSQLTTRTTAPTKPRRRPAPPPTAKRRPPQETRRLAQELLAANPTPTKAEVAAALGITPRRLRDVLSAPHNPQQRQPATGRRE